MPVELRDRRALLAGGVVLALLLLLYLSLPGDAPPVAPPPQPAPPPAAAPAPAVPQPVAAPAATPEGLKLHGITGAGAIIATADGRQRLVAVGRQVLPGLVLAENHRDHVLLRSGGSTFRLDFAGATATAAGGGPAQAAAPSGPASEAAIRAEGLTYRLGLAPRRSGQRITSHVVRPGVSMPALERARLRPGDVILRVNGSGFDQERMMELPWTIAQSGRVTFEIERGGRPMELTLETGRR